MCAFGDLPSAAEATVGHQWWPSAIGTDRYHILNGSVAIGTNRFQRPPILVTNGRSPNARYIKTCAKRRHKINLFKHGVLRQLKLRHIIVHNMHVIKLLLYISKICYYWHLFSCKKYPGVHIVKKYSCFLLAKNKTAQLEDKYQASTRKSNGRSLTR